MDYLLQFRFDRKGPTEVRIRYGKAICNKFELLDDLNTIRHICAFTIFAILSNFFKDNKCLTENL